uniref:Non-specific serine/threonine protein kinase n=1 Tax=Rhabditophanes sp. KR3021 TaxID=114890 RepID=A0AC35U476_9BILA
MGSVISAPQPTQVIPVETYLAEEVGKGHIYSLGSTRFMKVARADYNKVPRVVKIFTIADNKLNLDSFRSQILNIRQKLQGASNCLPFDSVRIFPNKYVEIKRPFIKESLYEKLSIRPFLMEVEKKWIAFQLLKALKQMKDAGVCHGDIKSQNVLVSSSLWVHVTDFASYKPSHLSMEKPTFYNFFYDISRRKSCYIAPERFKEDLETSEDRDPITFVESLNHSMDVFSVGCVLLELFTDGRIPFNRGHLIEYAKSNANPKDVKSNYEHLIECVPSIMQPLILYMIKKDPVERLNYVDVGKSTFPEMFEELYSFYKNLSPKSMNTESSFVSSATTKIVNNDGKLVLDNDYIISMTLFNNDKFIYDEEDERTDKRSPWSMLKRKLELDNNQCVVLLISLINTKLRVLKNTNVKMETLKFYNQLALFSTPLVIIDRMLPYVTHMLNDIVPAVRSEAFLVMTLLLDSINEVPQSEYRIFPDYIFREIDKLVKDSSSLVKMSVASNLGLIAMTALRFLENSDVNIPDKDISENDFAEGDKVNKMEIERDELQKYITNKFSGMCSIECTRSCLIQKENLTLLCDFFRSQDKINEIFSHMTTFLNNKDTWRIRSQFFYASTTIIVSLDSKVIQFLKRLLILTGLMNSDEFVIHASLVCFQKLIEDDRITHKYILDILKASAPFLVHPNTWLQAAVIKILRILDRKFTNVDLLCFVSPIIEPFIKQFMYRYNDSFVIANNLTTPIPRVIWDTLARSKHCLSFFNFLMVSRSSEKSNKIPSLQDESLLSEDCRLFIKKLHGIGLGSDNGELENLLTSFNSILPAISQVKLNEENDQKKFTATPQFVDLNELMTRCRIHLETLNLSDGNITTIQDPKSAQYSDKGIDKGIEVGNVKNLNLDVDHASGRYISGFEVNEDVNTRKDYIKGSLKEMLDYEQERYRCSNLGKSTRNTLLATTFVDPDGYKKHKEPSLALLTDIHEHNSRITKLTMQRNGEYFASSTNDGEIKLWSTSAFKNCHKMLIKSESTRKIEHGRINCIQFVSNQNCNIALATKDGRFDICDPHRSNRLRKINFDFENQGPIVDMYGSNNLIYTISHHSYTSIFDLRCNSKTNGSEAVWTTYNNGLLTSLAVDPVNENWMAATGPIQSCKITIWDVRFQMKILHCRNTPDKQYIKIWPYVRNGQCREIWASHIKNLNCDLYPLYTVESELGESGFSINPSDTIAVNTGNLHTSGIAKKDVRKNSAICAMAVCPVTGHIFTGDCSGAIRYWDTYVPERCGYMNGPLKRTIENGNYELKYDNVIKESTSRVCHVTTEKWRHKADNYDDLFPRKIYSVNNYHKGGITDMLTFPKSNLMISGDINGVLKVWKIIA